MHCSLNACIRRERQESLVGGISSPFHDFLVAYDFRRLTVMTRSDVTKNTLLRDVFQSNHRRQLDLFKARVGLSDVEGTNFRSAWQIVAGPTNQGTYLYSRSACHATCILEPHS